MRSTGSSRRIACRSSTRAGAPGRLRRSSIVSRQGAPRRRSQWSRGQSKDCPARRGLGHPCSKLAAPQPAGAGERRQSRAPACARGHARLEAPAQARARASRLRGARVRSRGPPSYQHVQGSVRQGLRAASQSGSQAASFATVEIESPPTRVTSRDRGSRSAERHSGARARRRWAHRRSSES